MTGFVLHRLIVRRLRAGWQDGINPEGLTIADIIRPMQALVVLLLAFVLFQTFASYQRANESASQAAAAVLSEADTARILPDPFAGRVVGPLRCYARAVAGPGWDALEETRRTSPIADAANDQVQGLIRDVAATGQDGVVLDVLLLAERDRTEARRQRLSEARPTVPGPVTVLLVVSVALLIGALAALTHSAVRPAFSLSLLVATTVVLVGTFVVIVDLDQPFSGPARIEPSEMELTQQRIGEMAEGADPPCDERGAPTGAG